MDTNKLERLLDDLKSASQHFDLAKFQQDAVAMRHYEEKYIWIVDHLRSQGYLPYWNRAKSAFEPIPLNNGPQKAEDAGERSSS